MILARTPRKRDQATWLEQPRRIAPRTSATLNCTGLPQSQTSAPTLCARPQCKQFFPSFMTLSLTLHESVRVTAPGKSAPCVERLTALKANIRQGPAETTSFADRQGATAVLAFLSAFHGVFLPESWSPCCLRRSRDSFAPSQTPLYQSQLKTVPQRLHAVSVSSRLPPQWRQGSFKAMGSSFLALFPKQFILNTVIMSNQKQRPLL